MSLSLLTRGYALTRHVSLLWSSSHINLENSWLCHNSHAIAPMGISYLTGHYCNVQSMQLSKTAGDLPPPALSIASSGVMKNSKHGVVFKLNSSLIPLSPTTKAGVF